MCFDVGWVFLVNIFSMKLRIVTYLYFISFWFNSHFHFIVMFVLFYFDPHCYFVCVLVFYLEFYSLRCWYSICHLLLLLWYSFDFIVIVFVVDYIYIISIVIYIGVSSLTCVCIIMCIVTFTSIFSFTVVRAVGCISIW